MKFNKFNVRPSSKANSEYSVYLHYDINHAIELYSGSKEFCNGMLQMIQETLTLIYDKVFSKFTEEKFKAFENNEGEILNITIGALNFEFVSRDYGDGEGLEVNCECFILGKGTYGVTEEKRDGKSGIPYDDEYCMHYFIKEMEHDFEKTRSKIIHGLTDYVIWDEEKLCQITEKDFTWDSLRKEN